MKQFLIAVFSLGMSMAANGQADPYQGYRDRMVKEQIAARGVHAPDVLSAMRTVPRHLFVPEQYRAYAHFDGPLDIGHSQTISQPYIVAYMTELLALESGDTVLEIGTGSGYQAAVLAKIVKQVYTIEIVEELGLAAAKKLKELGYSNVEVRVGDGYNGWPEHAPFDGIMVTAAPETVPQPLLDQLNEGGRLVIPVGPRSGVQDLLVYEKRDGRFIKKNMIPVRFVPFTRSKKDK
jgi:protein-L-isoaspartate(D-aspartate) O-methyltransferase